MAVIRMGFECCDGGVGLCVKQEQEDTRGE